MKFEKPALSFEQQLDLLDSRGMLIANRDRALFYLSHLNYYRLEAYWLPYEVSRDPHQFRDGTTFDRVLDQYLFDRELRLLVLDAIERIEVSFRTQWAYHISRRYGAHGYLINKKSVRSHEGRFKKCIADLKEEIQRSDEVFIKHYRDSYDEELPPAWVSCEVMSLGLLSRFYSNLRSYQVRRAISATYQFDEGFLEGFMEHLTYIRNVCAHHARLWNRHLTKKMPRPKGKPPGLQDNIYVDDANKSEHRIYNTMVVIQHILTVVSPDSSWATRFEKLIQQYDIEVKRMGFPEDWKSLPIWREALEVQVRSR